MSAKPSTKAKSVPLTPAQWVRLLLISLVIYRVGYHASYMGEVVFALAPLSDGALYERAALDIMEHPPWGTRPFYLQGAYAYLLSLGLLFRPWVSLGLLVQLALATVALWGFHWSMKRLWGPIAGTLCTICLLASPATAFYENKYLTASPTLSFCALGFAALVWASKGRSARLIALGFVAGAACLFRPNLALAVPFFFYAGLRARGPQANGWLARLAPLCLGLALAVVPMGYRNLHVTGHFDLGPVHGGGTSFYIGNNPAARGVWNSAGGLLSARVEHESEELVDQLHIVATAPRDQAREIGNELYGRAGQWIVANPGDWAWLELRKIWLTVGNDQLTQDYDWYGEKELLPFAHRFGLGFGWLMGLAVVGFAMRRHSTGDGESPQRLRDAAGWLAAGVGFATLVATIVFFTSAQHRLPLTIPLAVFAGPGIYALVMAAKARWRDHTPVRLSSRVLVVAGLCVIQAYWPRLERGSPHPVHYYNLALALDQTGDPLGAMPMADRAVELDPEHPVFRFLRAQLRRRLGDIDGAESDLVWLMGLEDLPEGIRKASRQEQRTVEEIRFSAPRREGSPAGGPDGH